MTLLALLAGLCFGAIGFIWFGYPALVWLTARLFGRPLRPVQSTDSARSVSVIVATRDAADAVLARVANLLDTEHPASRLEVVVALDAEGASATPEELATGDARVRVVLGDAPGGKAGALNAGVRAATGEILVMADARQRFDRRTIPELVAALEDQRFGAVSGALTLGGEGASPVHWYWALEKWLRYNEGRLHSSVGVTGAVYATRRELWPVVPAGALLDDVFVPMSLVLRGHRVGFTYAARAWDVRAFQAQGEQARKTRTLTGVMQLQHLLPGLLSPARNPICVQFVAHKLLRLATPLLAVIGLAATVPLLLILFARAGRAAQLAVLGVVAVAFSSRRFVVIS